MRARGNIDANNERCECGDIDAGDTLLSGGECGLNSGGSVNDGTYAALDGSPRDRIGVDSITIDGTAPRKSSMVRGGVYGGVDITAVRPSTQ